jgi:hypothetical protein
MMATTTRSSMRLKPVPMRLPVPDFILLNYHDNEFCKCAVDLSYRCTPRLPGDHLNPVNSSSHAGVEVTRLKLGRNLSFQVSANVSHLAWCRPLTLLKDRRLCTFRFPCEGGHLPRHPARSGPAKMVGWLQKRL